MLRAIRRASRVRVPSSAASVRLRKIGAVAAGLRIGRIAASAKRKPRLIAAR